MTLVRTQNGRTEGSRTPSSLGSLFDEMWPRAMFDWPSNSATETTIPRVNILETNDAFRVEMAAPGMTRDDFKVELDNQTLVISSERVNDEPLDNESKYTRREFSYQSFQRMFNLPETVESEKIEARYSNGVLTLVIPKREEARRKPVRTIQIK